MTRSFNLFAGVFGPVRAAWWLVLKKNRRPLHAPRTTHHALRFAIAALYLLASCALFAAPEVSKVEPPNWWLGHSLNPVRVMVTGKELQGARVKISGKGLRAGKPTVSASGNYLFVDVTIDAKAEAGVHPLKITTRHGKVVAPFEVLKPLASEGRFQGFSKDDTIYLIMPDRFADGDPSNNNAAISNGMYDRKQGRYYHGGDFQGVIDHLPYLKYMGVTALWLTPWYDNVNHLNHREKYTRDNQLDGRGEPITDYHGYGATDFYGVEEHFGDLAKLRELVDAAHRLGLKVIQDEVANHTGPYHPWATNMPTPTWLNGTLEKHQPNNWQTWTLTVPDAPADVRKQTLEGWFIDILPDLNQNDPECARYLIQNTLWWVGMSGVDGIRLDTLPYVPRAFWHDWRAAVKRQYPQLSVVGEMFDGDAAKVAFFQGGQARFDGVDSGIEALFDFPLYYAVRDAFAQGKSMQKLSESLAKDRLYVDPDCLVTFAGLHDVNRFMNERGADVAGLKLAFTFLMTTRGIPMIYYGDEIALRGGKDPDNRRDFPGGFPGDARNAFDAGGRTPEERELFERVQKLLHLRAELAPLRHGRQVNLAVTDKTYAYARVTATQTVVVLLNTADQPEELEFEAARAGLGTGVVLRERLGSGPLLTVENEKVRITLAPRSSMVYTVGGGSQQSAVGSHP